MDLLRLEDLFEAMKEILTPKYGYNPKKIKVKLTGIRPGEKLTEYLLTNFEMSQALETKEFFILPTSFKSSSNVTYPNSKKPKNLSNYFENISPMPKKEIIKFLKTIY